jgi:hypothetical protein
MSASALQAGCKSSGHVDPSRNRYETFNKALQMLEIMR